MNLLARPLDQIAFPARFATAEFIAMIETGFFDDMKLELVEGELQRMPPAGNDHARRQAMIAFRLAATLGEELARVEAGIDLGDDTLVAADVVLLRSAVSGSAMLTPASVRLVVEVAETTIMRDTTFKRLAYARAAIPLYWVVDAVHATVHVYADPQGGDYADVRTVRFGEPLAVPGADAAIVIE